MKILVPLMVSLLFLIPSVLSQSIALDITGICRDYNVTMITRDFDPGCYDVKIEITTSDGRIGKIFDPRAGWKSSIYYIDQAFCIENENQILNSEYQLIAETSSKQLYFRGSIRRGSKIWTTEYYEIENKCSQYDPIDNMVVLFIAILSIEIIILGLVLYDLISNR